MWIVTRFADLVIVQEDGLVWFLDTGAGSFIRIADSKDHFAELADDADTFGNWFLVRSVDEWSLPGTFSGLTNATVSNSRQVSAGITSIQTAW